MTGLKFLPTKMEFQAQNGLVLAGTSTIWPNMNSNSNSRFRLDFYNVKCIQIPATYPLTPIELELPELDGKTEKMYRGGKICLDIHFAPLWQKNTPKFGISHALAIALGPWLAVEIPILSEQGVIKTK